MALKDKIEEDLKTALRERKEAELNVLRMLKAALMNKGIEKMAELTDDDVLAVIKSEAKKRRESVEAYESGGRAALAEKEKLEIKILETYLPAQMGEAEIRTRVQAILDSLTPEDKVNSGQVIGRVMGVLKGAADGGVVNKIVRELLG